MDLHRAKENQKKWDNFLSTIETEKKEQHTQPITITVRKAGIQCLAYKFSLQLLGDSVSTVTVTGRTEDISTIIDRTDVSETFVPIKKSKSFPEHKGTPVLTTCSGEKRKSSEMQTRKDKTADGMIRDVEMPAQLVESIKSDLTIQRTRERNEPSPKKVKKDIDTPCSKWKMDLFSKHFDFDSTVSPLSIQAISSPQIDAIGVQIKEEVIKRCNIMHDNISAETTTDFFKGSNETTVRIILDAIFLTLCSSLGYNIEVETNIKSTILVPCVFDYRILHKGNVIGSIEAKSSEGLKKESIIQAVLQLTILQAEIIQRGAESPPPLFNIVTDGVRFIFIQLKGEKLGFEHNLLSKLHINRVESITDLEDLLPKLVSLVQMSGGSTSA